MPVILVAEKLVAPSVLLLCVAAEERRHRLWSRAHALKGLLAFVLAWGA